MRIAWLVSLITLPLLALATCQPAVAEPIPGEANQYRRTLVRAAHAVMGLDAPIATLAAQVHQESRWQSEARSPVGAEGIAQFMPATSQWMADIYPDSLGGDGNARPLNPGWALRAMVQYDQWLLARVKAINRCQQWAMVLSAYNGGLGWVKRDARLAQSLAQAKGVCPKGVCELVWFNQIERFNAGRSISNFEENRSYVRRIVLRWTPLYQQAGWGEGVCPGANSRPVWKI